MIKNNLFKKNNHFKKKKTIIQIYLKTNKIKELL